MPPAPVARGRVLTEQETYFRHLELLGVARWRWPTLWAEHLAKRAAGPPGA